MFKTKFKMNNSVFKFKNIDEFSDDRTPDASRWLYFPFLKFTHLISFVGFYSKH